ncbi:TetR/AcrR family transcriptional regulator [Streptomyces sp. NPDC048272]|uniref:TetR/AcrR family transcriptional regulator n=1 Tax=Streptomyces sp. NPDC048272 TaxID=3154616 RepID=UPI00344A23BB
MSEEPQPLKPQSERARWTYGRILDAAGEVFVKFGYEGAAINEIIRAAGITKGTFYYHFREKKDLAVALLESSLQVDGLVPQEIKLQEVVDTGMILGYKIPRDPKVMAALRLSLTHEARNVYGTPWPDWIKFNTTQLNEAQKLGEVGADVNTAAQAHQIAATWSGLVMTGHSIYGHLDGLDERIATMYENLMTVIAHPRVLRRIDFSPTRGRNLYQAFLDTQS